MLSTTSLVLETVTEAWPVLGHVVRQKTFSVIPNISCKDGFKVTLAARMLWSTTSLVLEAMTEAWPVSGHRGRSTPASVLTGGKPSDSPLFNLFLLFPPFLLFTLSSSIFSVSATAFTELRRGKLETGDQHLSRRRRGSRSNCQTCLFSTHDLFLCVFFLQVHG